MSEFWKHATSDPEALEILSKIDLRKILENREVRSILSRVNLFKDPETISDTYSRVLGVDFWNAFNVSTVSIATLNSVDWTIILRNKNMLEALRRVNWEYYLRKPRLAHPQRNFDYWKSMNNDMNNDLNDCEIEFLQRIDWPLILCDREAARVLYEIDWLSLVDDFDADRKTFLRRI